MDSSTFHCHQMPQTCTIRILFLYFSQCLVEDRHLEVPNVRCAQQWQGQLQTPTPHPWHSGDQMWCTQEYAMYSVKNKDSGNYNHFNCGCTLTYNQFQAMSFNRYDSQDWQLFYENFRKRLAQAAFLQIPPGSFKKKPTDIAPRRSFLSHLVRMNKLKSDRIKEMLGIMLLSLSQ